MPDPADGWTEAARAAVARFDPTPTRARQGIAVAAAYTARLLMQGLNRVDVDGIERFEAARALQTQQRGLLTFSNHTSLFDDPWVTACFTPPEWSELRWVAADAINFFGTWWKARIFSAGKAVPMVRGVGIDQPATHFLVHRLRLGDWIHVFPEGGRSRELGSTLRLPLKQGMAHLVEQAKPLLLGFHHTGMQQVLPVGARLPRIGNAVHVRFGEVLDASEDLAERGVDAIMAWVQGELVALEELATAR